jgi:hypothetical protein
VRFDTPSALRPTGPRRFSARPEEPVGERAHEDPPLLEYLRLQVVTDAVDVRAERNGDFTSSLSLEPRVSAI